MCVREAMGTAGLVRDADVTWLEWTRLAPEVAGFGSVEALATWRESAPHDEVESMFRALGRLVQDGESSHRTAAVMAHLLAPGIVALTQRRRWGDVQADELESVVAGQVWTTILEYPWHEPPHRWTPMSVLQTVARAVDREFGWGDRGEGAWRTRIQAEPETLAAMPSQAHTDQALQSRDVYWWALRDGRVSAEDLDVLLQLAVIASDEGVSTRSNAGLTSRTACRQMAQERGLTVNQVQYRARQALASLRTAAGVAR